MPPSDRPKTVFFLRSSTEITVIRTATGRELDSVPQTPVWKHCDSQRPVQIETRIISAVFTCLCTEMYTNLWRCSRFSRSQFLSTDDDAQFEELGVIDGRRLHPAAWG
eukprot:COSAG02_NODE_11365_length_1739_cov_2.467683_2_plen_107_part_01